MKKTIRFGVLSILALIAQSCSFGYDVNQRFTPLDPAVTTINCEVQPENVELVFEGEKVNFEYEKVGMIEVEGEWSSTDQQIMDKIKALAKTKCCDAIINLKRDRTDRQSGLLFKPEYDHNYSAITYHGIAVKKKPNNQVSQSQNQQ
jgi:hypothetical protein